MTPAARPKACSSSTEQDSTCSPLSLGPLARSFGRNMTFDEIRRRRTQGHRASRSRARLVARRAGDPTPRPRQSRRPERARAKHLEGALHERAGDTHACRRLRTPPPEVDQRARRASGVHPRHAAYGHHDGELSDGRRPRQSLVVEVGGLRHHASCGARCAAHDPRCLAEKAGDQKLIEANPKALATHFEAGDGPTECVHLLAQDFNL